MKQTTNETHRKWVRELVTIPKNLREILIVQQTKLKVKINQAQKLLKRDEILLQGIMKDLKRNKYYKDNLIG